MKKKTTVISKDKDNISSKLLGTPVQDIDLERFRKPIPPKPLDIKGPLTQDIVKLVANKFSLQIVFALNLEGQSLISVDVLSNCKQLIILNISNNLLKNLQPLSELARLQVINASQNKLENLSPLATLPRLRNLKLISNYIDDIRQVESLKPVVSLKSMALASLSLELKNPICDSPGYRQLIATTLPQLQRLDFSPLNISIPTASQLKVDVSSVGPFIKEPIALRRQMKRVSEQETVQREMRSLKGSVGSLQTRMRLLLAN